MNPENGALSADALAATTLLLRSIPVALYTVHEPPGPAIWIGGSIERVSGFPAHRFVQEPGFWASRLHPDERERVLSELQTSVPGRSTTEHRWLCSDGSYHWFMDDRVLTIDHAGRQLAGVWLDISEQKRAEEALATERARLAMTLRSIGDGVIATDKDGKIILINEVEQVRTRSAPNRTAHGQLLSAVFPRFGALQKALMRRRDGPPPPIRMEEPDGRAFEVHVRPIDEGPDAGGWVLVKRDVTREREIQRTLERQERLAAAGQLAAGIAHDFNNILTVVIAVAEGLKTNSALTGTASELLDTVAQQGRRGSQMIRQILDFSSQSGVSDRAHIDLAALLREIVKLLQSAVSERIDFRTRLASGEHYVDASPAHLQQILMNLAFNARDAMPGGGRLLLRLSRLTLLEDQPPPVVGMSAGDWCVLSVSDAGTGMPASRLRRVFDPFFTTKPPGSGTGLGLAQVYGLVRQNEGFINVSSKVGRGTTFNIYLPSKGTPLPATKTRVPERFPRGSGQTVLVVDDDDHVRNVHTWLLNSLGYHVLTAGSGAAALQVYVEHGKEIKLVVTDMVMPGMDGLALVRTLHQQDPALPMIVLSGYPIGTDARKAPLVDTVSWLQKPLEPHRLAKAVRRALGGGRRPAKRGRRAP